jgi:uncharacterized protein YybS (DUF2232 family)
LQRKSKKINKEEILQTEEIHQAPSVETKIIQEELQDSSRETKIIPIETLQNSWKEPKNQPYMSVNAQVEGAIMAAFSVIIGLFSLFIPFVMFVGPLPSMLLVMRRGIKAGFLATLVAGCVFSLVAGFREGIYFVVNFNLIGMVFGLCVKAKWSVSKILFAGTAVYVLTSLFSFLSLQLLTGIDFTTTMDTTIKSVSTQMAEMQKTFNIPGKEMETLTEGLKNWKKIIVASIIFAACIMTFLQYIIAQKILKKLGYTLPVLPAFSNWRLPWHYAWVFIAGFILFLFGMHKEEVTSLTMGNMPDNYFFLVGFNIVVICQYIYMVIGISILSFYMSKYKLHLILKIVIIYLLIPLLGIILYIGLFDTWMDFRKLDKKVKNEA